MQQPPVSLRRQAPVPVEKSARGPREQVVHLPDPRLVAEDPLVVEIGVPAVAVGVRFRAQPLDEGIDIGYERIVAPISRSTSWRPLKDVDEVFALGRTQAFGVAEKGLPQLFLRQLPEASLQLLEERPEARIPRPIPHERSLGRGTAHLR